MCVPLYILCLYEQSLCSKLIVHVYNLQKKNNKMVEESSIKTWMKAGKKNSQETLTPIVKERCEDMKFYQRKHTSTHSFPKGNNQL
jgi:hypothetical protein